MYRVLTADESRVVEQRAVAEQGLTLEALMGAAGKALAHEVSDRVPDGPVVVLAGPGNNGGDGWVAARVLHSMGREVRVIALRSPDELSGPAAAAARGAVAAGVRWEVPGSAPAAEDLRDAACVIDALLGTGAGLPLRGPVAAWCEAVNANGAYVVSADVPTGVDSDSGEASPAAVLANVTVTFIAPKRGLVTFPGAAHAGEVVVADIGVDAGLTELPGAPEVWTAEEYAALLPLPAPDAHKNSRGRVLVVAGSTRFPGAAVLATRGAMRAGAGYVTLAVPAEAVATAQAHLLAAPVVGVPSAEGSISADAADVVVALAAEADAVVVGPGLTVSDSVRRVVLALLERSDTPMVLDADALNAIAAGGIQVPSRSAPTVLTPHPGELARLLGWDTARVQADRIFSASALAGPTTVVVLKGAGTVSSGFGRAVINTSGTPALATAGTGDVLAGVIGALLAQGRAALDAAVLGAYLHGRAGESAAADLTPMGVTAEDLPDYLPAAAAELLETW